MDNQPYGILYYNHLNLHNIMGLIRQDYFFSLSNINFPDGGVYVFSGYGGGSSVLGIGSENNVMCQLPIDVTLVQCEARMAVSGTLGTSEAISIDLYVNGGAGGGNIINNLTLDSRINYAQNRALSYPILSTDYFDFLVLLPTWVTNPTNSVGLILTCYFETGLDRSLIYQRWYGHVGTTGTWNPAIRTEYFLGMGTNIVSTTNDMPLTLPYDGTIVGADLNCKNNGSGSADAVITDIDINGTATAIDNTWAWNNGSDRVIVALDSIAIPFTSGQQIAPKLGTPNWATPPTNTSQSIGLLIER